MRIEPNTLRARLALALAVLGLLLNGLAVTSHTRMLAAPSTAETRLLADLAVHCGPGSAASSDPLPSRPPASPPGHVPDCALCHCVTGSQPALWGFAVSPLPTLRLSSIAYQSASATLVTASTIDVRSRGPPAIV